MGNIIFFLIYGSFSILLLMRWVVNPIKQARQVKTATQQIASTSVYATYNKQTGTLNLIERNQKVSDLILLRDYTVDYHAVKPKEYIYTSATVGGITTGGVTEVGGYRYKVGSEKTGKYILTYLHEGVIGRIQLTDALYQQAKNSKIAQYLDNSKKQIRIIGAYTPSQNLNLAASTGNVNLYATQREKEAAAAMPDYEKCIAIKNWVAGIGGSEISMPIKEDSSLTSKPASNVATNATSSNTTMPSPPKQEFKQEVKRERDAFDDLMDRLDEKYFKKS